MHTRQSEDSRSGVQLPFRTAHQHCVRSRHPAKPPAQPLHRPVGSWIASTSTSRFLFPMEEATLFRFFINCDTDIQVLPAPPPRARAEHYKKRVRSLNRRSCRSVHGCSGWVHYGVFTVANGLWPIVSRCIIGYSLELEQVHETWEQGVPESPASVMQCCKGLRVCSTVSDSIGTVLCDHSAEHGAGWSAVMNENNPCVEMGTVTKYHFVASGALEDIWLHVQWDCGLERQYSLVNGEWRNLKAIDPAPTGLYAKLLLYIIAWCMAACSLAFSATAQTLYPCIYLHTCMHALYYTPMQATKPRWSSVMSATNQWRALHFDVHLVNVLLLLAPMFSTTCATFTIMKENTWKTTHSDATFQQGISEVVVKHWGIQGLLIPCMQ